MFFPMCYQNGIHFHSKSKPQHIKYRVDLNRNLKDCQNNKSFNLYLNRIQTKKRLAEIYKNPEYTPLQKERLALRVANNIDRQKQMIIENYKKKQLDIYNS